MWPQQVKYITFLTLFSSLAIASPAPPAKRVSSKKIVEPAISTIRLEQTETALRRSSDSLRAAGYRPLSLDAETISGQPRFATAWTRAPGPAWVITRSAPAEAFSESLRAWDAKGFRPTALAALESGHADATRFIAILSKHGRTAQARLDLDVAGFQAACDSARKANAKCEWIESWGSPEHPRFAAIFAADSAGTPWNYSLGDAAASLRTKLDIFARVWVRPARIAPMPGGRFATVWEENSAGEWAFHPDADARSVVGGPEGAAGLNATAIRAIPGAPGRYAAMLAAHDSPLPRAFTVTGPEAPGLEAFDGYMRRLMQSRGVRAGALAVAREGRLVFAHGYTWGEAGYPVTRPNSLFRAASCSKPLTSILVHRILNDGEGKYAEGKVEAPRVAAAGFPGLRRDAPAPGSGLDKGPGPARSTGRGPGLKAKVLSLLRGNHENADTPADARFDEITVDDLLTHSGGWARSRAHPDPVFNDHPPGSEIRKRLPASRGGFLSYMLGQPLQYAPGSRSVYDNFGYFLLGRLIESLPMGVGRSYQAVAGDLLWKPLGLSRPRFGGSRYEDRAPDEVLYHTAVPYLQADPVPGGLPWVAGAYGDFEVGNMDAAGAWLLSAPDYAKVLAAFDLGAANPILGPKATEAMWEPAGFGEALRGWYAVKAPSLYAEGDSVTAKWHNGLFPGTSTLVFYHPEKWSFALFLDRDLSPQPDGPREGRELAGLARGVEAWPTVDLFPEMGIPAFPQAAIGPAWGSAGSDLGSDLGPDRPDELAGDPK